MSTVPDRELSRLFRKAYRRFFLWHLSRILSVPVRRNFSIFRGFQVFLDRAVRFLPRSLVALFGRAAPAPEPGLDWVGVFANRMMSGIWY